MSERNEIKCSEAQQVLMQKLAEITNPLPVLELFDSAALQENYSDSVEYLRLLFAIK